MLLLDAKFRIFFPCSSIGWILYLQNKEDYWGNLHRISSLVFLFLKTKNSNRFETLLLSLSRKKEVLCFMKTSKMSHNLTYFFKIWKLKISWAFLHCKSKLEQMYLSIFNKYYTIWFNPLLNSKVWISLMVRVLHPKNCKVLSHIENTDQNLCCIRFFTSF